MCDNWPYLSPKWSATSFEKMEKTEISNDVPKVTLNELMENSEQFPIEFPIESVRCKTLKVNTSEETLERNITSAYPVIHEQALFLYSRFLKHKRKFGTEIERELYEHMTLEMLIDRFLQKRAVVFIGPHDRYMLLDGFARSGKWQLVGTSKEEEPLTLRNCLSYDEVKLSALLSVSSYTQFINVGDRNNCGYNEHDMNKIEPSGVIVGLIGPRFEKVGVMEYQDTVITREQNVSENGYGKSLVPTMKSIFFNFYEEPCLTYDELEHQLKTEPKFTQIRNDRFFNNKVYKRRLALSVDTFLVEANERARAVGTMAYLHVVGFGLGVWRISQHQNKLFMDIFAERIEFLSPTLDFIDVVCFSYMNQQSCGKYKHGDILPVNNHHNNGITIHIYDREPHEKLKKPYKGHLLVVSYAWDGNALPGNEFWWGQLAASGDPAAASSTQISELHNPHINPAVCGANLRVATLNGLLTLDEYKHRVKRQQYTDLRTNESD